MTESETHQLIERDAAFVEFYLSYSPDSQLLQHDHTDVGECLSGYDSELTCSCGAEFESMEDAKQHLEDTR